MTLLTGLVLACIVLNVFVIAGFITAVIYMSKIGD